MADLNRREFLSHTAGGLAAGALAGLSTCALGEEGTPGRRKPNIVYILTDQWRAQATGYAGDPNVKTPNLDELALESVNFENAVSVCPVCTPHRASLMTGRFPLSTGMFLNDLYLPDKEICMAEIFAESGYDTGYIGKWHLDGHGRQSYIPRERRQGFDYWKVLECTHNYNKSHYYAGDDKTRRTWKGYDAYAQTKDAQAYIQKHAKGAKPFLLVLGYGGPHFPHHTAPQDLKAKYPPNSIKLPPNVPERMEARAKREAQGYYAHCTALDRCIGDLQKTIDEAGISNDTILVFTSDHGEMMGSQGQSPCEKQRPWDESIRVPFLLKYPAVAKEKRVVKAPINTPDILPTLLSLSGIAIPKTIEGEDLSSHVKGTNKDDDRAALVMSVSPFAGYFNGKEFRGIRTARYSYVRSTEGPWLMYDNEADPHQLKNLIGKAEHVALQKKLDGKLQAKLKATGDKFMPRKRHQQEWGYQVTRRGTISYSGKHKVQSPGNRPK